MDIFFDESGQTGTNLFNEEQPYFAIASTNVPEAEATEILQRCFPRQQGPELKSSRLLRRSQGQRAYLDFAREVGRTPNRYVAVKIKKRHAIVSKMSDVLVEPLLRSQGYDFYAGGYANRFANTASITFDRILDKSVVDDLLRMYDDFAREPSAVTIHPLRIALDAVKSGGPDRRDVVLTLMADGARRIETSGKFKPIEDTNDVHVTSVVGCMEHWQCLNPGPFRIVHDESNHFFRRSERWRGMTNPAIPPQVIRVGERTLTLPIPVSETVSARSHECPSLQLCDLLAGVVSRYSSPKNSSDERDFFRRLIDSGLGKVTVFPLEAGSELIAGPPERSSGPDIIDRVVRAVATPPEPST